MLRAINPQGAATYYQYNHNGQIVKIADALENKTRFTYNSMGRVTSNARDDIATYNYTEDQFAYNMYGELVAMMDWKGTVNFELDALGSALLLNTRAVILQIC